MMLILHRSGRSQLPIWDGTVRASTQQQNHPSTVLLEAEIWFTSPIVLRTTETEAITN